MLLWYVAAGSALGGIGRYLLGFAIQQRFGITFPTGTLIINVTGSLLIGFLLRSAFAGTQLTPESRAFLATGFCGGYTTFSTFSFETAGLIEGGEYRRAALYILLSVGLSIVATFTGFAMAQSILTFRARG